MYYEVYVDVLFVENLCINMMLLFLTAWADQSEVHKFRIIIAAATGSAGACLLTILSASLSGSSWLLFSVLLAAGMIFLAFPDRKHLLVRTLCLYLESFALNGILRYLEQFHKLSGIWFAVFSSISLLLLTIAEYILRQRKKENERTCSVILHHGACSISVKALYDTGNALYDPISQKAVSILDKNVMEKLLEESGKENLPKFIPYHTISEKGILEGYVLDCMEFPSLSGSRWVKHPIVARMPEESGTYQLILHRDLLSS